MLRAIQQHLCGRCHRQDLVQEQCLLQPVGIIAHVANQANQAVDQGSTEEQAFRASTEPIHGMSAHWRLMIR